MRYAPTYNAPEVLPDTTNRPKLAALCKQLSVFRESDFDSLKPYFDDLLTSSELNGFLNGQLTELADDPMRAFRGVAPKRYQIFLNSHYALRLLVEEPSEHKTTPLTTTASGTIWGVLSEGCEVIVNRYKMPNGTKIDVFDPDVRLTLEAREELTANKNSIVLHAFDVFGVKSKERAVILALTEVPALPYVWEFERESLKPLLIQAVAPSISRLEVAINTLSCLWTEAGSTKETKKRCEDVLEKLTQNTHHFIRWKATQALFQLNRESGMTALRRAKNDSHPHVRQAALTSLANLSENLETETETETGV